MPLEISEQLDVIDSDSRLLAATQRQGNSLTFPGQYMPDGQPLVGQFEGDMSFAVIQGWCATVRSTWNARKERKEAQETEQAAAHRAAQREQAERSDDGGRSELPVEDDIEVGETSLEGIIRAKIAMLDRARKRRKDEFDSANAQYTAAQQRLLNTEEEYETAVNLLRLMNDTREVRPEDRLTFPQAPELGARGDGNGDPVVRRKVRKYKPRGSRPDQKAVGHSSGQEQVSGLGETV